jgi:hypothetical protein
MNWTVFWCVAYWLYVALDVVHQRVRSKGAPRRDRELLHWLNRHPCTHHVGLHGQRREGCPSPQYLADEIRDGYLARGEYREVTR